MTPDEFSRDFEDLLGFGPACPMPAGQPEPYAVHRGDQGYTIWMEPCQNMTPNARAEMIEEIKSLFGLPSAADLRKLHPKKARAERLIVEWGLEPTPPPAANILSTDG